MDALINGDFFLPFANEASYRQMREKTRRMVFKYVDEHRADLARTWATERPFELHLPGVVVSGRADVIFDEHDGTPDNLAIVDYKTTTAIGMEPLQLQIYADAARREGLTVGAAFIHDLDTTKRQSVPVDETAVASAEAEVTATVASLRNRDFTPKPAVGRCRSCDVRFVCRAAGQN